MRARDFTLHTPGLAGVAPALFREPSFPFWGPDRNRLRSGGLRQPDPFDQSALQTEGIDLGLRGVGRSCGRVDGDILAGCYLEGKDRLLLAIEHLSAHRDGQIALEVSLAIGGFVPVLPG